MGFRLLVPQEPFQPLMDNGFIALFLRLRQEASVYKFYP